MFFSFDFRLWVSLGSSLKMNRFKWKQPRCPSTDEWIKKLWYIYTMEYYSAIERNTFESVLMRRMNLERIIQSELNQKEKDKYRVLMTVYGISKNGTEEFIYRATVEKQT